MKKQAIDIFDQTLRPNRNTYMQSVLDKLLERVKNLTAGYRTLLVKLTELNSVGKNKFQVSDLYTEISLTKDDIAGALAELNKVEKDLMHATHVTYSSASNQIKLINKFANNLLYKYADELDSSKAKENDVDELINNLIDNFRNLIAASEDLITTYETIKDELDQNIKIKMDNLITILLNYRDVKSISHKIGLRLDYLYSMRQKELISPTYRSSDEDESAPTESISSLIRPENYNQNQKIASEALDKVENLTSKYRTFIFNIERIESGLLRKNENIDRSHIKRLIAKADYSLRLLHTSARMIKECIYVTYSTANNKIKLLNKFANKLLHKYAGDFYKFENPEVKKPEQKTERKGPVQLISDSASLLEEIITDTEDLKEYLDTLKSESGPAEIIKILSDLYRELTDYDDSLKDMLKLVRSQIVREHIYID